MASQVFNEPEQGRVEGLRLCISRTSWSTRQRPRQALKEAGGNIEVTRTIGPVLAAGTRVGASTRRTGGLPDAGEKTRIRQSDHHPGGIKERARLPRRPWGLGWRQFRA